jgi:hypothetical protein
MKRRPAEVLFGLCVLGAALPSPGADGLTENRPKESVEVITTERVNFLPGGTIRMDHSYGYLSVDGWDEPQVEVTIIKSTDRFYEPGRQEEAKRRLELIRVVTHRRSETELSIATTRASRHGNWAPPLPRTTKAGVTVEYRIRVPRDSRLVIQHDTGYVWVSDVTGDIEARSHTGDMIVMLPTPGQYSIDAKSRMGGITSDFAGAALGQFVVGTRFARAGEGASRRVFLRMGRGSITIKRIPPPWSPTNN